MRRAAPTVLAEARISAIQLELPCRQQDRYRPAKGLMGGRKRAVADGTESSWRKVSEAQDLFEERRQPLLHPDFGAVQVRAFAPFGVGGVEIVGDSPVAGELVLERKRFCQTVIRARLMLRLERRNSAEKLGREDSPLDTDGGEAGVPAVASHAHIPHSVAIGIKT